MKLTFLGSGSAFTVDRSNYQSNMLLTSNNNKNFLIDCGTDIRHSMFNQRLSFNDLDAVYISHLHADHVGGLEWLAFTTKFSDKIVKPKLYICNELHPDIWEHSLKAGLNTIDSQEVNLDFYFDVHLIPENGSFEWEGIKFEVIRTHHIQSNNCLLPSFGLFICSENNKVFITTDTRYDYEYFKNYYQKADVIFHDCETTPNKSGVHAHYTELINLEPKLKKKTWLYHYNSSKLPDAKKDGFCGFVQCGQVFNFS